MAAPPKLKPGELLQTALSGEYLGAKIEMTPELAALIRKFTAQSIIPLPKGIKANLRPYQERGYSWMYRNMKIGFGSIISDLPDKIERNELAPLTASQAALYQETLRRCMSVIEGLEGDDSKPRDSLRFVVESGGGGASHRPCLPYRSAQQRAGSPLHHPKHV